MSSYWHHPLITKASSHCRWLLTLLVVLGLTAALGGFQAQPASAAGGDYGKVNLALGKPVTPFTNTVMGNPASVTDGNISTYWYSYQGSYTTCVGVVDLQQAYLIGKIDVGTLQIYGFTLSTSLDNTNWTTRYTTTFPANTSVNLPVSIRGDGAYSARYIKYSAWANWPQYVGLYELQVFEWLTTAPTPPPPSSYGITNLAQGKATTNFYGSVVPGNPPGYAVDGNAGTAWQSNASNTDSLGRYNSWGQIMVDLGQVYSIGKVVVDPEKIHSLQVMLSDHLGSGSPPSYPSGAAWAFDTHPELPGTINTSTDTHTFYFDGAVAARYVWLFINNASMPSLVLPSTSEIQVYEFNPAPAPTTVWNQPRQNASTQGANGWSYYQGTPSYLNNLYWDNMVSPWGNVTRYDWNGGAGTAGPRYLEVTGRDPTDWRNIGTSDRSGWLLPGEGANIVIGWKAPAAGTVYLNGMLNTADPNTYNGPWWDGDGRHDDGVWFSIWKNTGSLTGAARVFHGRTEADRIAQVTQNATTTVNANDMIYFYVDRGYWQDSDQVYYSFTVSYDPASDRIPPASSHSLAGNQLSFSATDAGSGVARLEYAMYSPSSTGWTPYTSPITLAPGLYKFMYRALDNNGNVEPYKRVTIDTAPPVISLPANERTPVLEATGPAGASFTFHASATDNADPSPALTISPTLASYPLDTTLVTFTARDASGNVATLTATVTVRDTTAPTLTLPSAQLAPVLEATSPAGAPYTFNPTATDIADPSPIITISPLLSAYPLGTTPVTLTARDASGNTTVITATIKVVDTTNPAITGAATTAPNANGWYNGPVTIHFTASDSGSGVASVSPDVTLSAEGSGMSASGTATDNAGNAASFAVTGINIDLSRPGLAWGSPNPFPNSAGWNNSSVTLPYTASDALSGVASSSPSSPLSFSTEGTGLSTSVNVTDKAGNSASFTSPPLNIDKTTPVVTITSPLAGEYLSSQSVTVTFTAIDGLSGIAGTTATLDGSPVNNGQTISLAPLAGAHTLTVQATDRAGNRQTASVSFYVTAAANLNLDPNTLNLKSQGGANAITAYVEIPGYDVNLVDVPTVKLGVNGALVPAQSTPTSVGDNDKDGVADRMVKFDRQAVIAALGNLTGNVNVSLSGQFKDGRRFTGADILKVTNPGNGK